MDKKDMLRRLEANEPFKEALLKIADEKEREAIKSLARMFISDIADVIVPIAAAIDNDKSEEVAKEIEHLFSGSTSFSGSK